MTDPVGVLALQGAYSLHLRACREIGYEAIEVRTPAQLDTVERLIIPGGESTTMSMMLERNELFDPLAKRLDEGMPAFGTCAGMILLASEISDGRPDQRKFSAIDVGVRRNGYGRQNQSFSDDISIEGLDDASTGFHAVFIRAPRVEAVGASAAVLATYGGDPVLCRQDAVLVSAFHPELSADRRLHRYFCEIGVA